MEIQLNQIIDFIKDDIIHIDGLKTSDIIVKYLRPMDEVDEFTLDWINPTKLNKQEIAELSPAKAILVDPKIKWSTKIKKQGKILIYINNPKNVLAKVALEFFCKKTIPEIHKSAVICHTAKIGTNVRIDAGCVIGECSIGNGSIIYPNVTIYDNVTIGQHSIIQAGAVIGTDGLGCERSVDGTLTKFPHLGGVVIGNNVEIGANSQIAKGALSNTIIGDGTKINGLCFIAHNCNLGKNVWLTGNVMLAGSVRIEDNVTIYSNVIVREQRIIGKNATVGMGSVVTKNIPTNETWFGNPAKRKSDE